jgi:hypothetical protein
MISTTFMLICIYLTIKSISGNNNKDVFMFGRNEVERSLFSQKKIRENSVKHISYNSIFFEQKLFYCYNFLLLFR